MVRGRFFYHCLAFLTVAIWGTTFISTKVLILNGLHPVVIFAIRFFIAYLGILAFSLSQKEPVFSRTVRDELLFVSLGITGGSIYFLCENMALKYTMACNVSFIVCTAPLLTMLMTLLVRRFFYGPLVDGLQDVKICPSLIFGTLVTFAGLGMVIFSGMEVEFSTAGDLLAFGAAVMWGLYSILMGQMAERYGALFATRKVFFYGLVTIIPFLLLGEGILLKMDFNTLLRGEVWTNLLFLSLMASLLCFWLWNLVMAKLGNITSTNYVYLNPVFTFWAATLFLGEHLTLLPAIGSVAIVSGVILAGKGR